MPFDTSWEDQFRAIDQNTQGQVMQQGMAAAATPQQAQLVGANGAAAPYMGPGPAVALGMSGVAPSDPAAQALQQKAAKKHGGFGGLLGHIISPATNLLSRGITDLGSFAEKSLGSVGEGAKLVSRGVTSGLMSGVQAGEAAVGDVASGLGDVAGGAASGALTGAATGLMTMTPWGVAAGAVGGAVVGGVSGALAQSKGIEVKGTPGNPLAATDLWQAGQAAFTGQPVSLGSGFMPGGDVVKAQSEAARQIASINGHALTPGRMLAAGVFQPGSSPYNILSGSVDAIDTLKLDPMLEATKYVGDVGREANVFGDLEHRESIVGRYLNRAGAIDANAPIADTAKAAKFLDGPGFQNLAQKWADTDSASEIWNSTKKKIPASLASDIAKTSNASDVIDLVRGSINSQDINEMKALTEKTGIMSTIRNVPMASRLASYLPKGAIDMQGAFDANGATPKFDEAVGKFESWMKQARLDPESISAHTSNAMGASDPSEFKAAVGNAMLEFGGKLQEMGHDDDTISKVLKSWHNFDMPELGSQVNNELVNGTTPYGIVVNGQLLPVAKGNGILEIMRNGVNLPDARDVKQLTTPTDALRKMYTSDTWNGLTNKADFLMRGWRALAVTRPALLLRTAMMESAKMSAQGMETPITNPLQLIQMITTPAERASQGIGATGELLNTLGEFKDSMGGLKSIRPDWEGWLQNTKTIAPEDTGFSRVWGGKMLEMNNNPVTRYMAQHGATDTLDWLTKGEGQDLLGQLAKGDPALKDFDSVKTMVDNAHDHLTNVTKDHPQLMEAIANGKFVDEAGNAVHLNTLSSEGPVIEERARRAAAVAEDEVRKAIKRNQTGVLGKPEGEEEITDAERGAKRAAAKAARAVAEKELPTTYRAPVPETAPGEPGLKVEQPTLSPAEPPGPEAAKPAPPEVPETLRAKPTSAKPPIPKVAYDYADTLKTAGVEWKTADKFTQGMWEQLAEARNREVPTNEMKGMIRRAMTEAPEEAAPDVAKPASQIKFSADGEPVDWQKYLPPAPEPLGLTEEQKALVERARAAAYNAAVEDGNARALKDAGGNFLHSDMQDHLESILANPDLPNPERLPTTMTDQSFEAKNPGAKSAREGAVSWLFQNMIHKPLAELTRAPAFNQFYWQHIADLAPSLTEDAQTELRGVLNNNAARIPGDVMDSINNALRKGSGPIPLTEAHDLSAARTLESMHNTFLDLNKQQAWADASRYIFPFAKHWQQEMTQWARLGVEHPEVFSKATMTVHGLQGSGFFYKNDQGQWVFNYPFSDRINGALTGVPFPMVAQASGFSPMTQSALPGFGPMASIAASKILPNKPQWDSVRNLLAPYGDPTEGGVVGAIEPPWMKQAQRAMSDPNSDRLQGNAVMEVQKYLYSTGKYGDTPDEQTRLLDDAKSAGKWVGMLRSLGMLTLPSSPALVAEAHDKDGRTVVAQKLKDDLQAMDQADYSTATAKFMDKYGKYAKLFLQANTRPVQQDAREDDAGLNWLRSNPGLAQKFPLTAGFFAPPEGPFDPNAYTRALHTGDIEKLTPKQQMSLANDKYGNMVFYALKDSLGTHVSTQQARVLAVIRSKMQESLPGFGTATVGLTNKAAPSTVIDELSQSVKDPTLAATPVGQALSKYMMVRDLMNQLAKGMGQSGFQSSAKTQAMRDIMRQVGHKLTVATPAFGLVFDRVLDPEMKVDPVQQALLQPQAA